MRSLKLTAIFDEEKGPIQCRYVKVTRSRRVLKSMRRTNIIQGLPLTAIIDAEKGPIQCRFVKVTRSQPVLVEHAEDKYYAKFETHSYL